MEEAGISLLNNIVDNNTMRKTSYQIWIRAED